MKISSLAPRPPMGWNSFDCYGCAANERVLLENLEVFAERLKPAGYEYFVIDNGWFGEYAIEPGCEFTKEKHAQHVRLDGFGRYLPSKVNFPRGFAPIMKRAEELGVKMGIHLMRGISRQAVELDTPIKGTRYTARDVADLSSTCVWCHYNYGVDMDKPGAQAFYNSVVDHLADMGFVFIKADDIVPFPQEIVALADAIEQNPREIVFSLSPGGKIRMEDLEFYRRGNMLRITHDIWDRTSDLDKCFEAWEKFAGTERPGFWPDLDMICLGRLQVWRPRSEETGASEEDALVGAGHDRMDRLTRGEKQTFITMRALAASPLFMGGDLPSTDEEVYSLITNNEMIACDQNGVMGKKVYSADGLEAWRVEEIGKTHSGWIGLFNRTGKSKTARIRIGELGIPESERIALRDIWNGKMIRPSAGELESTIGANGVLFLRYW